MGRLVIFHYHLLPGGVTSVIQLSVRALLLHGTDVSDITICCGTDRHSEQVLHAVAEHLPASLAERVAVHVVAELDYITQSASPDSVPDVRALEEQLLARFGGRLWWVHNHHLGKNPIFTQAILDIAEQEPSQRIILHIHDFPESARYDNLAHLRRFLTKPMYPQSPNVHYACINERDRSILLRAGLPERQVTLLDNPVPGNEATRADAGSVRERIESTFAGRFPGYRKGAPLLFYPVRTIRRKNVLEAGLIARLARRPVNLVVTLPGVSERETHYSHVVSKCFSNGLVPGMWGIGSNLSDAEVPFLDLAASADCVVSSSVQEGFGYLFIDARRWKKTVVARRIDVLDGMSSFLDDRCCFLYDAVRVPWADRTQRSRVRERYSEKIERLRRYLPGALTERLSEGIAALLSREWIDFSFLPVDEQLGVLGGLGAAGRPAAVGRLNEETIDAIERLVSFAAPNADDEIEARFGLKAFARRLSDIAARLDEGAAREGGRRDSLSAAKDIEAGVLAAFAAPEYIRLIYD